MKLYHYFTLLVAVTISICAAYYSIVGLAAIFAAAAIPVIIMGAVLELAKITGAVWLKLYWNQASWWIKFYLIPAVAILMFITSLGIFGFLSKAHIEQTAGAQEGLAKLEQIETQIARKSQAVSAAEEEISKLENTGNRSEDCICRVFYVGEGGFLSLSGGGCFVCQSPCGLVLQPLPFDTFKREGAESRGIICPILRAHIIRFRGIWFGTFD
jgi:hypothetical protein